MFARGSAIQHTVRRLCTAALVGLVAFPRVCAASESQVAVEVAKDDAARDLYRQASAAAVGGDVRRAAELYRASAALHASPGTLFNLGYCLVQLGDVVAGARYLVKARALARELPHEDARSAAIAEQWAQVHVKLAQVRLLPRGTSRVELEGAALELVTEGEERFLFPVSDGGSAILEISEPTTLLLAEGRSRIFTEVGALRDEWVLELGAGETRDLSLPSEMPPTAARLAHTAAAAPPQSFNAVRGANLSPHHPAPFGSTSGGTAASSQVVPGAAIYSSFGLAVLGGALMIYGWPRAMRIEGELAAACHPRDNCPSSMSDEVRAYEVAATLANLGLAAAAVGVGLGTAGLVINATTTRASLDARGVSLRTSF